MGFNGRLTRCYSMLDPSRKALRDALFHAGGQAAVRVGDRRSHCLAGKLWGSPSLPS